MKKNLVCQEEIDCYIWGDEPDLYAPVDSVPLTKPIMTIQLTSSEIPPLCIEIMTGK